MNIRGTSWTTHYQDLEKVTLLYDSIPPSLKKGLGLCVTLGNKGSNLLPLVLHASSPTCCFVFWCHFQSTHSGAVCPLILATYHCMVRDYIGSHQDLRNGGRLLPPPPSLPLPLLFLSSTLKSSHKIRNICSLALYRTHLPACMPDYQNIRYGRGKALSHSPPSPSTYRWTSGHSTHSISIWVTPRFTGQFPEPLIKSSIRYSSW